jgi:hypothetical protein
VPMIQARRSGSTNRTSIDPLRRAIRFDSGFPYSEHFGATCWTNTLCGWSSIFHRYRLRIAHISLRSAFYTVALHRAPPLQFVSFYTISVRESVVLNRIWWDN